MKPAVCHILSAVGAAARGDVVYRLDLLLFVVAADLLVVHLQPEIFPFLAALNTWSTLYLHVYRRRSASISAFFPPIY